jgi:hypothetical protein
MTQLPQCLTEAYLQHFRSTLQPLLLGEFPCEIQCTLFAKVSLPCKFHENKLLSRPGTIAGTKRWVFIEFPSSVQDMQIEIATMFLSICLRKYYE